MEGVNLSIKAVLFWPVRKFNGRAFGILVTFFWELTCENVFLHVRHFGNADFCINTIVPGTVCTALVQYKNSIADQNYVVVNQYLLFCVQASKKN
ncbi:hypothetical protein FKM82_016656 [Ascaphus truei]